jgi:hypothetical protein
MMYVQGFEIKRMSYQDWQDHELPNLCRDRITEVIWDILRNEHETKYTAIYDSIYELVADDIKDEFKNYGE